GASVPTGAPGRSRAHHPPPSPPPGSRRRELRHRASGSSPAECPGRTIVPNTTMSMKLSEMKPDVIHLSSCMVNPKPGCPYATPEEFAQIVEGKTGIKVIMGTHDYH
ncbi:MAG: CGGC domain-containing protein, partial [Chloroflexota bacterium]|nr:CGGC domain-containing protein [Chloroflexota bacterium]